LWAHNPDNGTTWEIGGSDAEIRLSFLVAGGTLFYRVHTGSSAKELWAYDPSNTTAWQIPNATTNDDTFTSLGNTVYFTSDTTPVSGEHDLWAYNTANETTWFVTNISATNWGFGTNPWPNSNPTSTSLVFAGDTLYIREGGGMRSHQPASINYQTNTGGNVTTWAINASLPSGLTFSTTNGSIYGTPTELWTQTSYMVWANNSGGSSVAYLNITVVDEVPTSVTYTLENLTLTRGEVNSDLPLVPALTGPGDITIWGINASLPTGLSFGTNNGTIWGVAQVNMTTTAYTVWANNSGGSVSTTLNITVLEPIVVLDYNPENQTMTRDVAMVTMTPTVTGGNVETWEIHPSIPTGLTFADGVLSGTPTVNMTLTMFTIYANTTGGTASHTINLTINEPIVILDYNPENQTMTRDVAMVT
ncbi:MAG: putative Ig domain-containing protein, partial [Poseidonia sp.]